MARTAIGPFSLNTDESLDKQIVELFDGARSRGKSDLFREIMSVFFQCGDQIQLVDGRVESVFNDDNSKIMSQLARLLALVESGSFSVDNDGHVEIDSDVSKNDPLIAEAESALDKLAL